MPTNLLIKIFGGAVFLFVLSMFLITSFGTLLMLAGSGWTIFEFMNFLTGKVMKGWPYSSLRFSQFRIR